MTVARGLLILSLGAVATSVGCSAMPSPRAGGADPSSLADAQASLDQNEARLGQLFRGSPPPPASVPPPQPSAPRHEHPAPPDAVQQGASPCDEACRALGSMKRAADTICRLTSPDDSRCLSAQQRVKDGAARASQCACQLP